MRISEQKQILRRQIAKKRNQLAQYERESYAASICRHVINLPQVSSLVPGKVILTYMPIKAEVDVKPVMEWAWERKITVLLPRVVTDSKRLVLHRVKRWEELSPGAWNILEPNAHAPQWDMEYPIDVALIPGVAYDRLGYRLGQGGGYYDRLWEHWNIAHPDARRPYLIAPAYQVQIVDHLPMEAHDMRVDCIVTEFGTL